MTEETDTQPPSGKAVALHPPCSAGAPKKNRVFKEYKCPVCGAIRQVRADDLKRKGCSRSCANRARWNDDARKRYADAGRKSWTPQRRAKATESLRTSPMRINCIDAARKNASQFWTEEGRKKNIEGRAASELFKSSHKATAAALQTPSIKAICDEKKERAIAKLWLLKSPANRVYEFKNVGRFVRENEQLFSQEDLQIKTCPGGASYRVAENGLRMLRPTATKKPKATSWKGWTWLSITERLEGCVELAVDRQNDQIQPHEGRAEGG